MARERLKQSERRADVFEGEASAQQQAASAAGDAGELSALEQLHPDVLAELLQLVGFAEASRVRAVSKTMMNAVDNVAWRSLRLVGRSAEQLERAAASFVRPQQPENGQGARTRRVRAAKGCTLDVVIRCELGDRLEAVGSLFAACSASSGGIGGVSMCVESSVDVQFTPLSMAMVRPLSASEADGGSSHTLKSISFDLKCGPIILPNDVLPLLARLALLERLQLPDVQPLDAAAVATITSALPALRSFQVQLVDGAALAPFASHPALEELDISPTSNHSPGFRAFTAGPAARRLKKLVATFGLCGFAVAELSSLSRLSSLEKLDLDVQSHDGTSPNVYVEALADLTKLRELRLSLAYQHNAADLGGLARAVAALRAHSLAALRLSLICASGEPEEDAALAELLRVAGSSLVELGIRGEVLRGQAAEALAACPGLRRLRLYPWVPLAEAVGVLSACPRLEGIRSLLIPFDDEREVTEGLELLRRLAAACSLGDGSGCHFYSRAGAGLQEEECLRLRRLGEQHVASIFPKAWFEVL